MNRIRLAVLAFGAIAAACATHADPTEPAPTLPDGPLAADTTPEPASPVEDDGDGLSESGLEGSSAADQAESVDGAPFDPNDPDVEEVFGHITNTRGTAPPGPVTSYRSDVEWHTSEGVRYRGQIDWYQKQMQQQAEQISMIDRIIIEMQNAQREIVRNLRGTIMLRTAGLQSGNREVITWWSSGLHTEKDGRWVATRGGRSASKFPSFWFRKKDQPFVRFNVGKVGKKKIVFNVYPLEPG